MTRHLKSALTIVLAIYCNCIEACDGESAISVAEILESPAIYDGTDIVLQGVLHPNSLGYEYVYPRAPVGQFVDYEDVGKHDQYLDIEFLVPPAPSDRVEMLGKCVRISAKFREYSVDFLSTGWKTSEIGLLSANGVLPCRKISGPEN